MENTCKFSFSLVGEEKETKVEERLVGFKPTLPNTFKHACFRKVHCEFHFLNSANLLKVKLKHVTFTTPAACAVFAKGKFISVIFTSMNMYIFHKIQKDLEP